MSDPEITPRFIVNLRSQPVEIHRPGGVLVLPPRGRAELTASDLGLPQLQVLLANRQVSIQDGSVPRPGPERSSPGDPGPGATKLARASPPTASSEPAAAHTPPTPAKKSHGSK